MTESIISANRESALLNSLNNSLTTSLEYKLTKNFPNLGRSVVKLTCPTSLTYSAASPHSKEFIWSLPKMGIMTGLYIESQITTTTDFSAMDDTNLGERIFSDIELRTSTGTVLVSNTDSYIRARVDTEDAGRGQYYNFITNSNVSFSGQTIVVYTPVFLPFTEKLENCLDLEFLDNLQLRAVTNSGNAMLGSTLGATGLTGGTFYLYLEYYNLSSEAHDTLKAQNYSLSAPTNYLGYDTYLEKFTGLNATSQTLTFNCNNCVYATHVFPLHAATGLPVAFNTNITYATTPLFTLKMNGKSLFENIPYKMMLSDKSKQAGAWGVKGANVVTPSTTAPVIKGSTTYLSSIHHYRPITICYGHMLKDRTVNTGSVSLANTNTPQLVITQTPDLSASVFQVVHEYFSLMTITGANGRISKYLST